MKKCCQQSEKPALCESLVSVETGQQGLDVLQEHSACQQQPGCKSLPLLSREATAKELSELDEHLIVLGAGWCFIIPLTSVRARSKRHFVSWGMS